MVEYLVDEYVMGGDSGAVRVADLQKGGQKNHKLALLKGEESLVGGGNSSCIGSVGIYKTESSLVNELENL